MKMKRVVVRPASKYANGDLMFPGEWVETWILQEAIGVWFLVDFSSLQSVDVD